MSDWVWQRKTTLSGLVRLVLLNGLFAIVVPMLFWIFTPVITWERLASLYGYSLIYSNCIGGVLNVAMPIAFRRTEAWQTAKKWPFRLAVVVTGTAVGSLLAGLVMLVLIKQYNYWGDFVFAFRISIMLTVPVVSFVSLYEIYKAKLETTAMQLKTKELERERALKLASEARLSSLESRLQPHFLFNTINSVSSLIHDDPAKAELLLSRMAALLRFSLDSSRAGLVPLEQELRVVKDYLEIEKTRFESRLVYEIDVPDELLSSAVPPLGIQTLVENSIKYAVAPRRQGARVAVRARQQNGSLVVSVMDDGPGFNWTNLIAGHGIDHLQERLAALFKEDAQLEIHGAPGATEVRLSIPLRAALAQDAGGRARRAEP